MKVLYITFIDFGTYTSGSSVRPQKMYEAFLERGHEVLLLETSQSKITQEKRKKRIAEVHETLKTWKPDICYIEPSTYPMLLKEDVKLIKKIDDMGVPIGYFFRDAYYKFTKEVNSKLTFKRRIKNSVLRYLYYRDETLLSKHADIIYFPSIKMTKYFKFNDMRTLPPAGDNHLKNHDNNEKICIYVGGITKLYGGELLLKSFEILNNGDDEYKLILVCREDELSNIDKEFLNAEWLEIKHVSGDEKLEPLYESASLGVLPRGGGKYNEFTVSVKLFEYMSYGLPVISMPAESMAQIINSYKIGVVSERDAEEFAKNIELTLADDEAYDYYKNNVKKALEENKWVDRVDQLCTELSSVS